LKSSEKPGPKAPSKTGIPDLLDLFQKSKKPTSAVPAPAEKSKTQPSKEPSGIIPSISFSRYSYR